MGARAPSGRRARPAGARSVADRGGAPEHVESLVSDPRLVEERRAQIVRAAVKLFSEQGYYTTTIQQVAREAGISTGLVYQYFRDKDDLLKSVPGIGNAQTFGGLQFSMLIQLDPNKMAQLGVTVSDVANAVREQNATNPAGRLGREPAPPGTQLTIPVTTIGRLQTPDQFNDIIVRAQPNGSLVRVRDIGQAVLGSQDYNQAGYLNGKPTALALLFLRPGANALRTVALVQDRVAALARNLPPGITITVPFDTTPFVQASINEVVLTLAEALLLVALVVFVFLQSWRATLIPMLAVPVSVIGTFLGLYVLGMSINVLTLFALVLAIGIVVDDAIVVLENVERIMHEEGLAARDAALNDTDPATGLDDVSLEASDNIYLRETDGALRLALAHTYYGDIRLTVRDTSDLDENLYLVNDGEARFAESDSRDPGSQEDATRHIPNGTIFAERGVHPRLRRPAGDGRILGR